MLKKELGTIFSISAGCSAFTPKIHPCHRIQFQSVDTIDIAPSSNTACAELLSRSEVFDWLQEHSLLRREAWLFLSSVWP